MYRGLSAPERSAQRREALLRAGLELFGTDGYAQTSIRAVSAQASLNSRYFYESFSSREDLLVDVYGEVIREVATAVIDVTGRAQTIEQQAREGLRVAWTILTDDRRKAKVIAVEVVGVSDRLERLRRSNRHAFAEILILPPRSGADGTLADGRGRRDAGRLDQRRRRRVGRADRRALHAPVHDRCRRRDRDRTLTGAAP